MPSIARSKHTGPVEITCVTVDAADPHGLATFWAAALGWEATRMDEQISLCARPGVRDLYLEFVKVPEEKVVKNRVHLGTTAVADLDAEIERLCGLGATVAWEEDDLPPGVRNVVLRDPEGNEFCLGFRQP
jgi:predicted enzyme related to lactoylglutathione lyase